MMGIYFYRSCIYWLVCIVTDVKLLGIIFTRVTFTANEGNGLQESCLHLLQLYLMPGTGDTNSV